MKRILKLGSFLCLVLIISGCTQGGNVTKSRGVVVPTATPAGQEQKDNYIYIGGEMDSGIGLQRIKYDKVSSAPSGGGFFQKMARTVFNSSKVSADVQAGSGTGSIFGNLPSKIKRVRAFPADVDKHSVIYIAETDNQDHGKKIVVKDLLKGDERIVYEATDGYGIDEYALSFDNVNIAVWEVRFAQGGDRLLGGMSKVTQVNLRTQERKTVVGPQQTSNLSAEQQTQALLTLNKSVCIQYPLFFDFNNRLILDTFCPNAGGVWAAGGKMAVSGSLLQDYQLMQAGNYSDIPVVSGDGKYALIVRPQTPFTTDLKGVLDAMNNPRALYRIDLSNDTELKVFNAANQYLSDIKTSTNGNVAAYVLYPTENDYKAKTNGAVYAVNISSGTTVKLNVDPGVLPIEFTDSQLILGKPSSVALVTQGQENVPISTLGGNYNRLYSEISLYNLATGEILKGQMPNFGQYVDGLWKLNLQDLPSIVQSQLMINYVKINSVGDRAAQQQEASSGLQQTLYGSGLVNGLPRCRDIGITPTSRQQAYALESRCYDSPLYLYSDKELDVSVKSENLVYETNPVASAGKWNFKVLPGGKIISSGSEYSRVDYGYQSSATDRADGIVATQANLRETLSGYADKLGLNANEKTDFVIFWYGKLKDTAPYIQISHFSQAQSKEIVGLSISPAPDHYYPIVMYFKKLYSPIALLGPTFEQIRDRTGFTAVDWSGVIVN